MSAENVIAYDAARVGRLSGGSFGNADSDPNQDWSNESGELWARTAAMVRNDPVCAAIKSTALTLTHGSEGLRFRSLCDAKELRDQIEAIVDRARTGKNLDATGQLFARELDESLHEAALVSGEAFAIRCWLPDRAGAVTATCWRILRRDRIKNRPGDKNSASLFEGFALDKHGAWEGVWIAPPIVKYGDQSRTGWVYVPCHGDDGTPNIIHRVGMRPPGSFRGVTPFAQILFSARKVKAVLEAYIVAKEVQAAHPIFIKCDDPAAAARADRRGAVFGPNTKIEPGKIYYVHRDSDIVLPQWSFNGGDLREFVDTYYRNECAAFGLPIDIVLAQLGETNMAASRSAWLQAYRQAERWQNDHINQVSRIVDACSVAEAIATGELIIPEGMPLRDVMAGRYIRPPRAMPDPLKEAAAVAEWIKLGRDKTGLFAESGVDFRESVAQASEDRTWEAEYAPKDADIKRDADFVDRVAKAQEAIAAAQLTDLPWPVVIAAGAANTAPGAFIGALAGAPDATADVTAKAIDTDPAPAPDPEESPA